MPNLSESLRPRCLAEVVGQAQATSVLRAYAMEPYSECWLLAGPPGTGKTSSALALANELGSPDIFSGLTTIPCSELDAESTRTLLRQIHMRPLMGDGWNFVLLEELERVHPVVQVLLKVGLDKCNLPPRACIVATSNDTSLIPHALLQRFERLDYVGRGGTHWERAGLERVHQAWQDRCGEEPMPVGWEQWGRECSEGRRDFSLRVALDRLHVCLLRRRAAAAGTPTG